MDVDWIKVNCLGFKYKKSLNLQECEIEVKSRKQILFLQIKYVVMGLDYMSHIVGLLIQKLYIYI